MFAGAAGFIALLLAAQPTANFSSPNHDRCVGMFLDTGGVGSRVPQRVPADATKLNKQMIAAA